MQSSRLGVVGLLCLLAAGRLEPVALHAAPADDALATSDGDAPLFRVFLKDGHSLVSYGEVARLDNRIVFSMPTSPSKVNPDLHLVDIALNRVDWPRTEKYTEAVRADRYLRTRAEADYALLTTDIAQALNDIGLTSVPLERLAIVERARKVLADWPPAHYGYKQAEVRQMLGMMDEAIADLRAAAGGEKFDLRLVASVELPAVNEAVLPSPSPQEVIEGTLVAAKLTDSPAERSSLLAMALAALNRSAALLPASWLATTRAATAAAIAAELAIDRVYRRFTQQMLELASVRARAADVRGVERVLTEVTERDKALGRARPDTVVAILAEVDQQLDAARRLRLARDRWAIRMPELQKYRATIISSFKTFADMEPVLKDVKALTGSGPDAIDAILKGAVQIQQTAGSIDPPEEFRDVHTLLVSAAQMAESAARIRLEAALTGSVSRAWDASSAAAGALMLSDRARTEMQNALRPPQLPQ